MARYERHGGRQTNGRTEPGRDAFTFFGYSATHSSASTEVVEFKVASDHHNPTRNELYKDHRVDYKPRPVPAQDHRSERGYEYSPKVGNHGVHVQTKGLSRDNIYRDYSPSNSPKVGNHGVYVQTKGSPRDSLYRDNSPSNSPKVDNYVVRGQTKGSPWDNVYEDNSPSNSPKVNNHVARVQTKGLDNVYRGNRPSNSPKVGNHVVHGQTKGSPWDNVYRDTSPPSRDNYRTTHHYGKYPNNYVSSDEEDDDDVICKDGVCYKNPSAKQNHIKDKDYQKEKNKGNGYDPPSYTTTQPRKDAYYETSNGNNPPHIRTRTHEPRWGPEFQIENNRNSPVSVRTHEPYFNASPRKNNEGHREIMDRGSPRGVEHYTGKIDCKEAAKKYKGVLVST
ncbi:uncharacterized protein LOC105155694 [Sesamum indicum]|uniref:Uncharacterized protein LOC105155694 n=1 Tax=Sesamum indicum TaxID=4182 RepID=A0A6I9SLH3_SESIN|nr:uncharacterized protein LOC105155694 [Sesamum indicum]